MTISIAPNAPRTLRSDPFVEATARHGYSPARPVDQMERAAAPQRPAPQADGIGGMLGGLFQGLAGILGGLGGKKGQMLSGILGVIGGLLQSLLGGVGKAAQQDDADPGRQRGPIRPPRQSTPADPAVPANPLNPYDPNRPYQP